MFDSIWQEIGKNSILDYTQLYQLYSEVLLCEKLDGTTAEIGVYEGYTSKMIAMLSKTNHYCYDTFEGIIGSSMMHGDNHENGEFICNINDVKQNINLDNVIYKKGIFPSTFQETYLKFKFVYSDTGTYLGAKSTFDVFAPQMVVGGKIVFYTDANCIGVKNAIREFINFIDFDVSIKNTNIFIFTKK